MLTALKKCRVCGKDYEACHTVRKDSSTFRWQEVACSPECGNVYLERIMQSRAPSSSSVEVNNTAKKNVKKKKKETANIVVDIGGETDLYDEIAKEDEELNEYFGD